MSSDLTPEAQSSDRREERIGLLKHQLGYWRAKQKVDIRRLNHCGTIH